MHACKNILHEAFFQFRNIPHHDHIRKLFCKVLHISEVNFVESYFLSFTVFCEKINSVRCLTFSRFCDLFIVGSKTKSAACCDV